MSKSEPNFKTATLEAWAQAAAKSAPGGDLDALNWLTPDGIAVKPLYTAADLQGLQYTDTLPGFEPYLRGPQATMYAVRPVDHPPVRGLLHRRGIERLLPQGAGRAAGRACSVAFDLATHRGYDSDHPRVTGDVGKAGVAIDSVEDMKILFDGIPLDKVSVSMTMNGAVLPVLAGYVVAAEEQGVAQDQLSRDHPERHPQGVHGPQHLHLPARADRCASSATSSSTRRRRCRSSTRSRSRGYHMQEAGANQALELAFTLADGKEYVKTALAKGLDVDDFAGAPELLLGHRHELLSRGGQDARRAPAVVPHHEGASTRRTPRA